MKRRELIKTGLLGLGVSTLGLTGCKKDEPEQAAQHSQEELIITPKQTGTYEFSVPLPFDFEAIDNIAKLNTQIKKSKVTSFYNGAVEPLSHNFNHWVHLSRGRNDRIKTYDDFLKYVDYARQKGFEFTYLMNSPKSFSERDFATFKDELAKLMDLLIKHNVKNIKVANVQVATVVDEYAPGQFTFSASCAFEYKNLNQYRGLFSLFPNFNSIDMSYDENQNFHLLKSIRDSFPSVKLELMVNEVCAKGCPMRASCIPEMEFVTQHCSTIQHIMGNMHYFTKGGSIYPWWIKYYSALGINNFKYVALDTTKPNNMRDNFHDTINLKAYLKAIDLEDEDFEGLTAYDFFAKIFDNRAIVNNSSLKKLERMKLTELIGYLPNIEQFIKHGSECGYKCGKECNYCLDCAKKVEKMISA